MLGVELGAVEVVDGGGDDDDDDDEVVVEAEVEVEVESLVVVLALGLVALFDVLVEADAVKKELPLLLLLPDEEGGVGELLLLLLLDEAGTVGELLLLVETLTGSAAPAAFAAAVFPPLPP